MAAALFLMQYQFRYLPTKRERNWRVGRKFPIGEIEEWLRVVEQRLRAVDRNWKPGARIRTRQLENERAGYDLLRAGYAVHELGALAETLREVFPFISENEERLDARSKALRVKAKDFAYTAWRTARAWRLAQTTPNKKDQNAFVNERTCIINLASALRDAECYLESAFIIYLFLRLTPDEVANASYVSETLKNRWVFFSLLTEAGFEIDPRFVQEHQNALSQERQETQGQAPKNEKGFFRVVRRDQETLAAWATITSELPQRTENEERLKAYVRRVLKVLASDDPASPEVIEAGYSLALRYAYTHSAAAILARAVDDNAFPLKAHHVLRFVRRMVETTAFDPFALDYLRFGEWQRLVRRACSKLWRNSPDRSWISAGQRLRIHEALLGRTITHHQSLGYEGASRLFGKAVNIFSIDDLREFYDREHDFMAKPRDIATGKEIAKFCRSSRSSELGPAVYVSVLCMENLVSIVGIAGDGRVQQAEPIHVNPGDLERELRALTEGSPFWFRHSGGLHQQIRWADIFDRIGRSIMGIAHRCDSRVRVIMLAVEPHLATLPWQHLISMAAENSNLQRSADQAVTRYLVAIVPNASVAIPGDSRTSNSNPGIQAVLTSDLAISTVADVVRRTSSPKNSHQFSICVLVGHGHKVEGRALPIVELGDGRQIATIEQWIATIRSRHVVLHCCHSGGTEPLFMQELGGLPGLALSLGSATLLAPVKEVGDRTAITLQESLFENPHASIGQAYLSAISDNRSVCLYNLFGNPYETLLKSPASIRRTMQ